jgi:hypothetical protein
MYICGMNKFQECSPRVGGASVGASRRELIDATAIRRRFVARDQAPPARADAWSGYSGTLTSSRFRVTNIFVCVAPHFDTEAEKRNTSL